MLSRLTSKIGINLSRVTNLVTGTVQCRSTNYHGAWN